MMEHLEREFHTVPGGRQWLLPVNREREMPRNMSQIDRCEDVDILCTCALQEYSIPISDTSHGYGT